MTPRPSVTRHVLDSLTTAVLVFDRRLRLKAINTAGENLLSISGRKIRDLSPREILPRAPRFAEALERALANVQPYTEWDVELKLGGARSVVVDCMITPVLEGERCRQLIAELVNTHTHARIVREENLLALHGATREFMRAMAHEVKNPLGGLRGAAQLLERELEDPGLKEYTRIIISEADRLRSLVDRMLGPNGRGRVANINIHEVLEYVCSLMEAESNPGVALVRDYDPSLPELKGDRDKLIQALINVLRNAYQAVGTRGEICLRTRIGRLQTIGQKLYKLVARIEVIDSGPGIPPEIGASAFYPLVTGRADGTGLGLSIAQSLIQEHGGLIEYERREGKTVFKISLPLEGADEQP